MTQPVPASFSYPANTKAAEFVVDGVNIILPFVGACPTPILWEREWLDPNDKRAAAGPCMRVGCVECRLFVGRVLASALGDLQNGRSPREDALAHLRSMIDLQDSLLDAKAILAILVWAGRQCRGSKDYQAWLRQKEKDLDRRPADGPCNLKKIHRHAGGPLRLYSEVDEPIADKFIDGLTYGTTSASILPIKIDATAAPVPTFAQREKRTEDDGSVSYRLTREEALDSDPRLHCPTCRADDETYADFPLCPGHRLKEELKAMAKAL